MANGGESQVKLMISNKGVIPDAALAKIHLRQGYGGQVRDPLPLIKAGDAGSGSGMTKFVLLSQPITLFEQSKTVLPHSYFAI